ncbi:MAG: Holliday junction resolvase RuvX, partial [Synergistaceae bacterium]|nr:Holliday junction resolvase RuvX [Synergistaceae bacterium]
QRIVAADIGSVRVGIAVSDPLGTFAQALTVLNTKNDWIYELKKIMETYQTTKLLVGLPLRTGGSEGPEAENIREITRTIAVRYPDLEIIFWDERFTTVIAQQSLIEGDVSRKGRKERVDMVAASLLLQSYLDHGRHE